MMIDPTRPPHMQRASNYLLGRSTARDAFRLGRTITLSAFDVPGQKALRYVGPVTQPADESKPSVRYRVRLTRRPGADVLVLRNPVQCDG